MPDQPDPERVTRLISETDRALRTYLRTARLPFQQLTPAPGPVERTNRFLEAFITALSASAQGSPGQASGVLDPLDGTVFPDNERGVRALAKEIKRLIGEDKRRGLDD